MSWGSFSSFLFYITSTPTESPTTYQLYGRYENILSFVSHFEQMAHSPPPFCGNGSVSFVRRVTRGHSFRSMFSAIEWNVTGQSGLEDRYFCLFLNIVIHRSISKYLKIKTSSLSNAYFDKSVKVILFQVGEYGCSCKIYILILSDTLRAACLYLYKPIASIVPGWYNRPRRSLSNSGLGSTTAQ
jgi:hypothetical protein